jgi:hypothetical protein
LLCCFFFFSILVVGGERRGLSGKVEEEGDIGEAIKLS